MIAWIWWFAIAVGITAIFYALYRYAEGIERQEELEAYERAQRESYAAQLESMGMLQEAQWVREGRKWW